MNSIELEDLDKPIGTENIKSAAASSNIQLRADEIAILSATPTIDIIFHASLRSPEVVKAITESAEGHPTGFLAIREYLTLSTKDFSVQQIDGWFHWLIGHAGEQEIAKILIENGETIFFADTSNNEGWDFLVNGVKANAKITMSPEYIKQSLIEHPNVDIYTNSEMGSYFINDPHVHVIQNLHYDDVAQSTHDTFDGFLDLGRFVSWIPSITLTVSSLRNLTLLLQGRTDLKTAFTNIGYDTAGVGLGGAAGGYLVGAWLGPVGYVIGAIAGGRSGKFVAEWVKIQKSNIKEYRKQLIELLREFSNLFYEHCDNRIAELKTKLSQIKRQFTSPWKRFLVWVNIFRKKPKWYYLEPMVKTALIERYERDIKMYKDLKIGIYCIGEVDEKTVVERSYLAFSRAMEHKIYFPEMKELIDKIQTSRAKLKQEIGKYERNTWVDKALKKIVEGVYKGIKLVLKGIGKIISYVFRSILRL